MQAISSGTMPAYKEIRDEVPICIIATEPRDRDDSGCHGDSNSLKPFTTYNNNDSTCSEEEEVDMKEDTHKRIKFLQLVVLILLAGVVVLTMFFYMQNVDLNEKSITIKQLEKIIDDLRYRSSHHNAHAHTDVSDIDGGGWQLVRHVPAGTVWHKATDQLTGTDSYGTPCGPTCRHEWSVRFLNIRFNQFLIITGDRKKWLIANKDQLIGSYYSNQPRLVNKSSKNSSSYYSKWYRRKGHVEDPWVSLGDYEQSVGTGDVLYGEGHYMGKHATDVLDSHNGANVYIRLR